MTDCNDQYPRQQDDPNENILVGLMGMLTALPSAFGHVSCATAKVIEDSPMHAEELAAAVSTQFSEGMRGERGGVMADIYETPIGNNPVTNTFESAPFPEQGNRAISFTMDR